MSGDQSMPVVLLEWKLVRKNSLRGFVKVRLGRSLVIHDIAVLQASGRAWAPLPGKPMTDRSKWGCVVNAPPRMTAADIDVAVKEAERDDPLLGSLLRRVRNGTIDLACMLPGVVAPLDALDGSGKPSLVFLADHRGGGHDPGPGGWPELDQLARWAETIIVNQMRERMDSYCPAVDVVLEHRRLVLVETSPSRVGDWVCALSKTTASIVVFTLDLPESASPREVGESLH